MEYLQFIFSDFWVWAGATFIFSMVLRFVARAWNREGEGVMSRKQRWLEVLTSEQRELRKQGRFDEIDLTDEQKEELGEEGCCWIESPSFYAVSNWCG